jgi:hypothetical protein
MRKVFVEIKVKLVLNMDEGVEVAEVINELDYNFKSTLDGADVEDTEILGHEVTDSK